MLLGIEALESTHINFYLVSRKFQDGQRTSVEYYRNWALACSHRGHHICMFQVAKPAGSGSLPLAMKRFIKIFARKRSLLIIPMLCYFGFIASVILADFNTVSAGMGADIFIVGLWDNLVAKPQ